MSPALSPAHSPCRWAASLMTTSPSETRLRSSALTVRRSLSLALTAGDIAVLLLPECPGRFSFRFVIQAHERLLDLRPLERLAQRGEHPHRLLVAGLGPLSPLSFLCG